MRCQFPLKLVACWAVLVSFAFSSFAATKLSQEQETRAKLLVKQLGAKDFKVRESASNELIRMGAPVEPILREGMKDNDPEVRFRCRTILPLALTFEMEKSLSAFLAGKEDKQHPAPAGWDRFKEIMGDNAATRVIFASMHRNDGEFLEGVAKDPAGHQQRMTARCIDLMQSMNYGQGVATSPDQLALLLFVALDPKLRMESNAQSYLSSALLSMSYRPAGKQMIKSSDVVRKLLLRYVESAPGYSASNCLHLLSNLEMKTEALAIARKMLNDKARDAHVKGVAIAILGKHGSAAMIPELLPYLDDKTSMGEMHFNIGQGNATRIKTQTRDVALAVLIQLSGQNLADYNFAYFKMIQVRGININFNNFSASPSLFGFSDDTDRDAAMKKWNDWYAQNKSKIGK